MVAVAMIHDDDGAEANQELLYDCAWRVLRAVSAFKPSSESDALTVVFYCRSGRHRSVAMADSMGAAFHAIFCEVGLIVECMHLNDFNWTFLLFSCSWYVWW